MEEQTHFDIRSAPVAQELLVSELPQYPGRFYLEDQLPVDEKIEPLDPNDFALEKHICDNFPEDLMAASAKYTRQRFHIHGFEEAVSKLVVDLVESPDRRLGQLTVDQAA